MSVNFLNFADNLLGVHKHFYNPYIVDCTLPVQLL